MQETRVRDEKDSVGKSPQVKAVGNTGYLRQGKRTQERRAWMWSDSARASRTFPTPERIREAAKRSLDRCETFYTPVGGTPELKKAVAHRFAEDYQLVYSPDQIVVSCGAKHSLYNIFHTILDPGDEVLIFSPYWVSYPEMVALAGGKPVIVPTTEEKGFVPDPDEAASLITRSTKAMLINSPSNPSGVVYPTSVMEGLAELAEKHDLLVISDEIYDKLIYDNRKFTPFASVAGMKDRTVTVNGVSKTYAMTGLRIGYLACTNAQLVKAATDIQSQSTSNPSNPAQAAAVEALTGPQEGVERMRQIFERRRNLMTDRLREIPGMSLVKPARSVLRVCQCLCLFWEKRRHEFNRFCQVSPG